jgi:Rps23 Pro-64 3,4-dihydroxylase Tpa1-like proline 4-hydroxylase
MKIHICNDNKVFPFLYVDDWYTPEEEKLIWKELDYYTNPIAMHRAEDDKVTARIISDGTSLSKAWRIYIDAIYTADRRDVSHILRLQRLKTSSNQLGDAIDKTGPNFRLLAMTHYDEMLVNYYENGDYYEPHCDDFVMTTICWFYRTPKSYTGGGITFTDIDVSLECNHNRMVMFPSYYLHTVDPIKMKNENLEMGWGRYSIQNFLK